MVEERLTSSFVFRILRRTHRIGCIELDCFGILACKRVYDRDQDYAVRDRQD